MALRAYCDYCSEEIKNQDKDIVDIRVTSYETPITLSGTIPLTGLPQPSLKMIILCIPCRDKWYTWLGKK